MGRRRGDGPVPPARTQGSGHGRRVRRGGSHRRRRCAIRRILGRPTGDLQQGRHGEGVGSGHPALRADRRGARRGVLEHGRGPDRQAARGGDLRRQAPPLRRQPRLRRRRGRVRRRLLRSIRRRRDAEEEDGEGGRERRQGSHDAGAKGCLHRGRFEPVDPRRARAAIGQVAGVSREVRQSRRRSARRADRGARDRGLARALRVGEGEAAQA
mmetsp:Transcript_1188/g.4651  ORF Transcript_1188/g.4651 Transcript_1188/m.4651 type:complete len:212 (-) Transcript_1188:3289-3924(-)